ncbi:hypothetical protein ACTXT7_004044 [Hymenolepis weldensis]
MPFFLSIECSFDYAIGSKTKGVAVSQSRTVYNLLQLRRAPGGLSTLLDQSEEETNGEAEVGVHYGLRLDRTA